jgi:cell cycle checkpoint control protein RAD9A
LNLSKTAYASFSFDAESFFISYSFNIVQASTSGDRFTCQLLNKVSCGVIALCGRAMLMLVQALQSVFKLRSGDPRGRETAIDRCDVAIQDDQDVAESRFVVKMITKSGATSASGRSDIVQKCSRLP